MTKTELEQRLEPPKRKRGLFSCDRCKTRKIACQRVNGNSSIYDTCISCQTLQLECKTTLERKKRRFKDSAITKVNNEYAIKILGELYPNVDFTSTAALKECYEQIKSNKDREASAKQITRNPRNPLDSYSTDIESEDENIEVIYSGKSIDGIVSTSSSFGQNHVCFDRVIYDNDGISHYMGAFGFTNLLTMLLNDFIRLTKKKDINSIKFIQSMNERGSIIASFTETTDLKNIETSRFPLVCYLSKEEAAYYVSRYSQSHHGLLAGINQEKFQTIYDKFWKINAGVLPTNALTYAQYCCIYTVWINGISIELHPDAKMQETYEIMDKYINLIKVLLSDIFLSPSPDGILSLLLLSFFFERNMQVETSYILCQTAVCHAMTCGFHRESIANNETSYLWWSLFDREMKLSLYTGRSSKIPLKQVNLKYEQRFKESLDINSKYNLLMTELNRLIYIFLSNRAKLSPSSKHLNQSTIDGALHMDGLFQSFYDKLPPKVKTLQYLHANEAEVLINYYSVKICSSLPFLLYPVESLSNKVTGVLKLIESCVKAAVDYVKLVLTIDNFGFENMDFYEALITSYCMLSLISSALFYKISCNALPEIPANADEILLDISKYSKLLKEYNEKKTLTARGTSRVRRYWTQVLYEDLEFLYANVDNNASTIRKLRRTILNEDTKSDTSDQSSGIDTFDYVTLGNISNFFDSNFDNYLTGETLISEAFNGLVREG